ncbi:uncharacterized protein NPIL_238751 [Nephila pilipes]|uniref:Sushi domain-containing protein n=1 Tax=Nephila pilipes TaxID=299642 RepID=A0A8X6NYD6_NEPPI|nr:uncharacterized protein NPIL_238751 [Nephila pilipes]
MRLLLITITISVLCVESKVEGACRVPQVNHGKMGKYVGYRKNRFKEVYVGNKVEEKEEMYLRCENNYEVSGKPTKEEKITCDDGEWSTIPECQPAQCRTSPPPIPNARIFVTDRTYGGGRVVYLCKTPFVKVKFGYVFCDFGTWKGVLPECRDFSAKARCPKFEDDDLLIKYNEEASVNSLALFKCKGRHQELVGSTVLTCLSNGRWSGVKPHCKTETPIIKNNKSTSYESSTETSTVRSTTILTKTTKERIPFTTPISEPVVPEVNSVSPSTSDSTLHPTCFCTYESFDEYLVAVAGTERLQNGSRVENGSTVKFFCQFFGYLRLQGSAEILCKDCLWQTSEFPECAKPETGETTILINGDWKLLPTGIVGIKKGKVLNILCDVKGVDSFPQWSNPTAPNIYVENYQDYYTGRNVSMVTIVKTNVEHAGKYQCFVPGYAPYVIDIEVVTAEEI